MESVSSEKKTKKPSGFKRVMKAIFVHNIGYKIFAVVFAAVLWALSTGLL